jgi:hypothetical protein
VTTTYRVLYWQEIPSQIKAEDEQDEVTVSLPQKFMDRIDQMAARRGLTSADAYLAEWHWSEDAEREGSAADVAEALLVEFEAAADW